MAAQAGLDGSHNLKQLMLMVPRILVSMARLSAQDLRSKEQKIYLNAFLKFGKIMRLKKKILRMQI